MLDTTLETIRNARQLIWLNEPADIARLREKKGTRGQGASAVLYAHMKLGQLAVMLNHLRGEARQGRVDLPTMKTVTASLLEFYAAQYVGFYQLIDTAQVVRQAKEALTEIKTLQDYGALVSELALYIGRVDYWVDFQIPWAKFGEVFEEIAS